MMESKPLTSEQYSSNKPECLDRRKAVSARRKIVDRRSLEERRFDTRVGGRLHKTLKAWFKSLTRARLGVDRRKNRDRRKNPDRRQQQVKSILTKEEISDLLS